MFHASARMFHGKKSVKEATEIGRRSGAEPRREPCEEDRAAEAHCASLKAR
jgi:hypothetical protein